MDTAEEKTTNSIFPLPLTLIRPKTLVNVDIMDMEPSYKKCMVYKVLLVIF